MNLIVNAFDTNEQVKIIDEFCDHCRAGYVCHIAEGVGLQDRSGRTIELLTPGDIGNGRYDLSVCAPLDEATLEKLLPTEAVVLKMMDRLERYLPRIMLYAERRSLYLRHVQYWNHIIQSRRITFFLSGIPHEVYDYVIYALCKIHGIPTLLLHQSQIIDVVHPMTDLEIFTPEIPVIYEKLLRDQAITPRSEFPLSPVMQREWDGQHQNVVPFYMKLDKKHTAFHKIRRRALTIASKFAGKRGWTQIVSLSRWKRAVRNLFLTLQRWKATQCLLREYRAISVVPDLSKRYVYVPLHYQPEMSTCPMGGVYCDQELMAELLDRSLPDGVHIYVKEHPMQQGIGRTPSYYTKFLDRAPKTVFVSQSVSSFELIRNATAVATVSGTAGWEALFREKPVLLFGHNFYQYAPGVYPIKTAEHCRKAIEAIFRGLFKYDAERLKMFLMAVDAASIKGYWDLEYKAVSRYTLEESNANMLAYMKSFAVGAVQRQGGDSAS
jgi:hypothetical protein